MDKEELIKRVEGLKDNPMSDGCYDRDGSLIADALDSAIDIIEQSLEGYAIVPVDPTGFMVAEGMEAFDIVKKSAFCAMTDTYKAMLEASKGE